LWNFDGHLAVTDAESHDMSKQHNRFDQTRHDPERHDKTNHERAKWCALKSWLKGPNYIPLFYTTDTNYTQRRGGGGRG